VQLFQGALSRDSETRYARQIDRLQAFIHFFGGPDLRYMVRAGAIQALLLWVIFFLQTGYDTGEMGLGEAANTLCGLRRHLMAIELETFSPTPLSFQLLLKPLWQFYAQWRQLEPYEFRVPVPWLLVRALLGVALSSRSLLFALFVGLGFCCLLRR